MQAVNIVGAHLSMQATGFHVSFGDHLDGTDKSVIGRFDGAWHD